MAELFAKILCPIDFDENSLAALDLAAKLAQHHHAALYAMHVVMVSMSALGFPEKAYDQIAHSGKTRLMEIARTRIPADVRCEVDVKVGNPAEEIVKLAEDIDVDLIVMATHGKSRLPAALLGSVAQKVVRESQRPVLTVKARAPAPPR
jgi:nucleotide-binding universal stress UspA family protein